MQSIPSIVLLADRGMSFLDAVRDLLSPEFDAILMVGDGHSLCTGAVRLRPTMIVIDLSLGEGDGLRMIERLRSESPESLVVALTVHSEPAVVDAAIAAGAHGVVLKCAVVPDLIECVDRVGAGNIYVSPALTWADRVGK